MLDISYQDISSCFVLRMVYRVFLVVALLDYCAGFSSVSGPPERVLAYVGEDVILPCSFDIASNRDDPTVEWSKEDLQPNVIFLYRDGCETFEMKHPAYEYKTHLIMRELKNGKCSLRISNIQLSDAGTYQCMRIWKDGTQEVTKVELVVAAVPEPKLQRVSAEDEEVTLQCEVSFCWLPQPEVKFLDDQGKELPAEDPKRDQDASGCYTVRQRMTLQTATNSVTCRVQQPEFNLTTETKILILAVCMSSCSLMVVIAVGVTVLVSAITCGLVVWLWNKYHKSADAQKQQVNRQTSDQSTSSGTSKNQSFLENSTRDENVANDNFESLAHCEVIHEKEDSISQPQNLPSPLRPIVCQHNQPTDVCSDFKSSPDVQRSPSQLDASTSTSDLISRPTASTNNRPPKSASFHSVAFEPQDKSLMPDIQGQNCFPASELSIQRTPRRKSTPADLPFYETMSPSSFSFSNSRKKVPAFGRSMSESSSQTYLRSTKPRRLSSGNCFSPLADLNEESKPLINSRSCDTK
ncbi:butyrophilin subfamily 3 member A2-like isoform X3 [Anabas testudineus]|uniref:butyrophilin subfamily 3 member A2-like isoform X3 n=1 Tax=Anabas testudineus TaxID=64144 RepID=UPI000E45D6EF|nr:butyrophilin subfamily 3 member A2-like isoform X3 [Anabas testudineus]